MDEHALDVVRVEPLGEQLGEDEPRLRRGKDGVERHVRRHPMVGMIHVALAVEAHRRVPAHHGVGHVPADYAREIPPQGDGGLEHAVLVAEKHDVADAERLAGPPLLLFAYRDQRFSCHVQRRRLIGPRAAARDADGDDAAPRARPLGERPSHGELLIIGMGVDAHRAGGRRGLGCRLAPAARAALGDAGSRLGRVLSHGRRTGTWRRRMDSGPGTSCGSSAARAPWPSPTTRP